MMMIAGSNVDGSEEECAKNVHCIGTEGITQYHHMCWLGLALSVASRTCVLDFVVVGCFAKC